MPGRGHEAAQRRLARVGSEAALVTAVFKGAHSVDELLTDQFVRQLHGRLYDDICVWAGVLREDELNIGVAPEQIAVELHAPLDTIRYRWRRTSDWTPRQLGIAAHAETVRIHPCADGNGRTTRRPADLVFTAMEDSETSETLEQYDWMLTRVATSLCSGTTTSGVVLGTRSSHRHHAARQ